MKKRKSLGALFFTAILLCTAVQPVFAATPTEEPIVGSLDLENTFAELTNSKKQDMTPPKAESPEFQEGISAPSNSSTQKKAKRTLTETMNEGVEAEEPLDPTITSHEMTKARPSVTTDSITWEGGLLKIPLDLGDYAADELELILRFEPENTESQQTWRYPVLEGNFATYSPLSDFTSCDIESFWTKQGTYKAVLEFYLPNYEDILYRSDFSVVIPTSSALWQVEEKTVKFDGSQDITFSFKNGTNYYELKSIEYIEFFMWKGGAENPIIEDGFTYNMETGTLVIDKSVARKALIDAVHAAQAKGLEKLPTNASVNAYAVTSSGEEVRFNTINWGDYGTTTAWELDLTDFDWTQEELQIVPEATDYTYTKGDGGGATIKCTGALEDFVSVYVDGNMVDPSNYTLESGSTILTFTTKYLNTLSVGKHKVTMNYTYGSVDTDLTIRSKKKPDNPSKSDKPSKPATPAEPAASATPAAPAETVTPTSAAAPTSTTAQAGNGNTSGNTTSVQTGDNTSVMLWVLAAMSALGTCGVLGWKRYSGK